MKKKLKIPKFKNEEEELKFWSELDASEYFDPSDFERFDLTAFLSSKQKKPKTKRITVRLPEEVIAAVKKQAEKLDVPYQSLMKQYIQKAHLPKQSS